MSSIPHQHSASHDPAARPHGVAAAWLWGLLALAVLGTFSLVGYRSLQTPTESGPVSITTADTTTVISIAGNRDAEPLPSNPMPDYPAAALNAGLEGDVIVRLQIDANGRVSQATVVGHEGGVDPALDQAAIQALQHWRFQPAMRDGRAINSVVQVPVEFRTGR
ncbi:energy transducer TonB [Stenotrophomonas sp. PS02298]|uniref:energy transducer TonB n=1 Tax=Stenotrophomonas sp. PS02298 TaxID=2991424 RepID=UPI00249A7395|nr:energy transducer TonB [Stenotrophomonas sp. PS02298]